MADDWIKMRINLWTHPKVVTLSSQLSVTRAHTIGALHCAWGIADQHADQNGTVTMSGSALDILCETPGLSAAMESIGWLIVSHESVQFLNYQQHNGTTGKQRADAQRRQRVSRKCHKSVTESCDRTVTREEKRREEENTPPIAPQRGAIGFEEFWSKYPRKTAKAKAHAAWAKLKPSPELLKDILEAIDRQKGWRQWVEGYIPHPATWINGRRWEDEPPSEPSRNGNGLSHKKTTAEIVAETVSRLRAAKETNDDGP